MTAALLRIRHSLRARMTLSVSLMRLPVLLAALVLGACDAATAPLSIPVGRYEAVRYDGALLADARICGVLSVATSTLVLETGGRAAYIARDDAA